MRTLLCSGVMIVFVGACGPVRPSEPKSTLVAVGDTVWRIQKPGRPSVWDETDPVGGVRQARAIYLDELEGLPLVGASVSTAGDEVSVARSQIEQAKVKPIPDGVWLRYDLESGSVYFRTVRDVGKSFDIVSCSKDILQDANGIELGRRCAGFANYTPDSRLEVTFYDKSWGVARWGSLPNAVENSISKYRENVEDAQ